MIYGSGLRSGDANIGTVPSYAQVNVGIKREFLLPNDPLPMTVRFDVVNLFDSVYEIRRRNRHRRIRAAIRAAPRLLPWSLEEDMRSRRLSDYRQSFVNPFDVHLRDQGLAV